MNGTHTTHIWTKSNCFEWENQTNQKIFDLLGTKGYTQTNKSRVWTRDRETVVACLVDDISYCLTNDQIDLPYLYDKHTLVLTDNYINAPTLFKINRIPDSFFGIYSYTPDVDQWSPDRDFSFSINRIDRIRLWLFLDLAWRTHLDVGYVNFNCENRFNPDRAPEQSFSEFYSEYINSDLQVRFAKTFDNYKHQMPYKNYDCDFESIFYRSWLNIVVETYSNDNTIALSEKIFRALVTPAPWMVYSGRYTVAYLESLGFDCASDVISHSHYDSLKEQENKVRIFNWKALEVVKDLKKIGVDNLRQRYAKAAEHNQQILRELRNKWATDFDLWYQNLKVAL